MSAAGEGWPTAVRAAETGTADWRAAVVAQRSATPDHAEFYALASEVVGTLRALDALANVLARQIAGYGRGRVLRDDEGLRPGVRLADAVVLLGCVRDSLGEAEIAANRFWSAVGHIAVEDGAR